MRGVKQDVKHSKNVFKYVFLVLLVFEIKRIDVNKKESNKLIKTKE